MRYTDTWEMVVVNESLCNAYVLFPGPCFGLSEWNGLQVVVVICGCFLHFYFVSSFHTLSISGIGERSECVEQVWRRMVNEISIGWDGIGTGGQRSFLLTFLFFVVFRPPLLFFQIFPGSLDFLC